MRSSTSMWRSPVGRAGDTTLSEAHAHGDYLPGHELAGGAGEEEHETRDVLGRAEPAERILPGPVLPLRVAECPAGHRGVGGARIDGVHGDAGWAELERQRFGE